MPAAVDRDAVVNLVERARAQLVEVLPAAEYAEEHLPDAISRPLKALNGSTAAVLDAGRPVVVYCWDAL
jgi:rhodanese-related sulfurtransferase